MKLWSSSNGDVVKFMDETELVWVDAYEAHVLLEDTKDYYTEEDDFEYWYELDTNDMRSYAAWCKANNKEAKFIGNLSEYTSKVYER